MMRTIALLLSLCFQVISFFQASAGDILYKVDDIPKELRENARSVVRMKNVDFEVRSAGHGVMSVTYAVTVMSKSGLEDANLMEFYDKYKSVILIKGRIFGPDGTLVRKFGIDDIDDYSAIAGFSMYEDSRVKYIDPKVRTYPFTVEYSYQVDYNGLFQYPSWNPQLDYNISVENSSFSITVNEPVRIRYLERNLPVQATIQDNGRQWVYSWKVSALKAIVYEPQSPPMEEFFPSVIFAPDQFEIGGVTGKMGTWEELGDWINELNEGKDLLSPTVLAQMREMVKGESNDREKVELLYNYMQSRVRYVNVKIGMGGWQPAEASDVERLSFGDCKGLSIYMKAMLKAVGIESVYCLVRAGAAASPIIRDFPSPQFNHAILCVPLENDTIWLECTDQNMPCGFLGDFTDDREVLAIKAGESTLVRTTAYSLEDNVTRRNAELFMEPSGIGRMQVEAIYKGLNYQDIQPLLRADETDRKKMVSEKIRFPNFQVESFQYSESDDPVPSIQEQLVINFANFLTLLDSNYLLTLNCVNHLEETPSHTRSRKRNVWVPRPFHESDSIIYHLPDNLVPDMLPQPVLLATPFGSYFAGVERIPGGLLYTRELMVNKGTYPAASYKEFDDFFEKVAAADDLKCTLVDK